MYVLMILITAIVAIILIVGLIEPSHVIQWGYFEDKTRKNVLKYFGTTLLVCLVLLGITNRMAVNEAQKEIQEKADQQKKAEEDKKKAEINANKKYLDLLDSGKTYENMTTDERSLALELFKKWDNMNDDIKNQYKTKKETLEKNKDEALVKWKAEREAEKAKKEEEEKIGYDTGITYDQLARNPNDYKGKKAKFTGKVLQVVEGKGEIDLRIAVNGSYDNVLYVTYNPIIISSRVLENDSVTVKGVSQGIYTYKSTLGKSVSVPLLKVDIIEVNK